MVYFMSFAEGLFPKHVLFAFTLLIWFIFMSAFVNITLFDRGVCVCARALM